MEQLGYSTLRRNPRVHPHLLEEAEVEGTHLKEEVLCPLLQEVVVPCHQEVVVSCHQEEEVSHHPLEEVMVE